MIEIQHLTKKYNETTVFEDLTYSFPNRGFVSVLGPSGCGKSTLLNLLAGFDSKYEGELLVNGQLLSQLKEEELCEYRKHQIGFVFQNYHLLKGYSALENVLLAAELHDEDFGVAKNKALEMLKKVGLEGKVDQKTETLSGGQKQRVAIARALVHQPAVLLCDEPTGALDRKNSMAIMELLKEISNECLVIMITHDKKCADCSDYIVRIEDGKLVGDDLSFDAKEVKVVSTNTHKINGLARAWKNIKVNLSCYLAVAVAISFGVLCFTVSLSSSNMIQQSITDFEQKNVAYHNGSIRMDELDLNLLERLQNDERLEYVYVQHILENLSLNYQGNVIELEEDYPMAKAKEVLSYGTMPRYMKNEIALSPSLAMKMEKDIQSLIGKTLELTWNGKTYSLMISGIFNAGYDDMYVSSDIEEEMNLGNDKRIYAISYDVKRLEDIVVVNEELRSLSIQAQMADQEVKAFLQTFQQIQRLFIVISILVCLVSVFIGTILLWKLQQTRYHEIGLLSALGYSKQWIRNLLFKESLMVCGMTLLCSVGLSLLFVVMKRFLTIEWTVSMTQGCLTMVGSTILILLIQLVIQSKLISTEPSVALRK